MRHILSIFIGVLIVGSASVSAEEKASKEKWKEAMVKDFPVAICAQMKSMVKIKDGKDCTATVAGHASSCIGEMDSQLPAQFDEPQVREWAPKLTSCVFSKLKGELQK